MTYRPEVRRATRKDAPEVLASLTLAFMADEACRFLYRNPHDYLKYFPRFIEGFGGGAFENSGAYFLDGHVGAALWLPPGVTSDDKGLSELFSTTLTESHRQIYNEMLVQLESYLPPMPHWHLAVIGVDPLHQNKGYGSVLLEAGLAPCDAADETAYVESSGPQNVPFYERFGFELLDTVDTGSWPPIYPMIRRPRSLSTSSTPGKSA